MSGVEWLLLEEKTSIESNPKGGVILRSLRGFKRGKFPPLAANGGAKHVIFLLFLLYEKQFFCQGGCSRRGKKFAEELRALLM